MILRLNKQRAWLAVAVVLITGVLFFAFTRDSKVVLLSSERSTPKAESNKTSLNEQDLHLLKKLSVPDRLKVDGSLLKPLLIPRVSGTPGNKKVQGFIKRHFKKLGWNIEEDQFKDSTPLGVKSFNNIVVSKFPNKPRKLILAAHFDSKYYPNGEFIGATDSAVPCAILMDVASTLDEYLSDSGNPDVGLELVFLDGEEAFVNWNREDSVYGARHLANKWSNTPAPDNKTRIETIELFVLLDLIGAKGSTILNLGHSDTPAMNQLVLLEKRLSQLSLLSNSMIEDNYFSARTFYAGIDDDHRPFQEKGVSIAHLIPYPFPDVWHKFSDNAEAIDHATVVDFSLLMRAYVAEYLRLFP
ncbi:hypothetical protein K493DRAFT_311679 [Basidiobolus meristosporus CBS 931.73]|uniref:Peptide hydrolase n=1 Tax=Basidiobolus meristosporus CBS 931.73 TaxID=1314790 RepID=A0A1Y1Z008_9FUNG|nr:hypothetical protein K493DRAFT_311679 [Basidiobolus meristosporus CBS 931.73]|eukprot:ORY03526.1 hypothetical protein K493DRAFT_311679 [Basidiobolus meristosporus CBS 931.73]